MPQGPNKLSEFWQELKRRNVTRVLTVYIAVAFMLLELIDMISEPFALPDWSMKVGFFVLLAGLIFTFILSYIYDVQPEGGLVKTEDTPRAIKEELSKSANSWKVASYISFGVIVVLIVWNIVPGIKGSKVLSIPDKSIAVLPFKYMSNEADQQYLADGTMDAIVLHLSRIKDLRVMSRTSVEQYRSTTKTASEICQELGVGYLLEGSFQKSGDQVRLIVQLIRSGTEAHAWANNYDRDWRDIFAVQSEVAQLVAEELHVAITPEEKKRMEKFPTYDLTAYELYQKGLKEYWQDRVNLTPEKLRSIRKHFMDALDLDSTLAPAYTGLAQLGLLNVNNNPDYFKEDFLDTVLILADKAIALDPQLSEAYSIKGSYYSLRGMRKEAILFYNKALELNPNDWNTYYGLASMYFGDDLLQTIDNFNKAILRYNGPILQEMFFNLALAYYSAGTMDGGDRYTRKALEISGDSALYFHIWGERENMVGNYEKGLEYQQRAHSKDTAHMLYIVSLGLGYAQVGQFQKAIEYFDKMIMWLESTGQIWVHSMHFIGYAYWMSGDQEKGAYYLNMQKQYCLDGIRLGRWWPFINYDLASIYAFQGERNKAFEYLRIFNQRDRMPQWMVSQIKDDPLFDSIRDEPEFQQIVRDVEAKYQAEHEMIRQWLEENGVV